MSRLILFFFTIFHHCLGDQVEQLDKQMDEQKSLHSILQAQIKRQERSVKTSCTQIFKTDESICWNGKTWGTKNVRMKRFRSLNSSEDSKMGTLMWGLVPNAKPAWYHEPLGHLSGLSRFLEGCWAEKFPEKSDEREKGLRGGKPLSSRLCLVKCLGWLLVASPCGLQTEFSFPKGKTLETQT